MVNFTHRIKTGGWEMFTFYLIVPFLYCSIFHHACMSVVNFQNLNLLHIKMTWILEDNSQKKKKQLKRLFVIFVFIYILSKWSVVFSTGDCHFKEV